MRTEVMITNVRGQFASTTSSTPAWYRISSVAGPAESRTQVSLGNRLAGAIIRPG